MWFRRCWNAALGPAPKIRSSMNCSDAGFDGSGLLRAGLQGLAKLDRMRHRLVQLVGVEFTFREADDDTGNAIADEIGQCAAFAHELVDADKNGDRLDRDVGHDG